MKTIIAGSSNINDREVLQAALNACEWVPTSVLCGCAPGADTLVEQWALENDLPIYRFPANWKKFGKRAGFLSNEEMADSADALIALWDGRSVGTRHMLDCARRKRLSIHVWYINQQ